MTEKKTPEEVAREMEGFEATELSDDDLDLVAGGVALEESNGNCGGLCSPGDDVPGGSWDNGNCT